LLLRTLRSQSGEQSRWGLPGHTSHDLARQHSGHRLRRSCTCSGRCARCPPGSGVMSDLFSASVYMWTQLSHLPFMLQLQQCKVRAGLSRTCPSRPDSQARASRYLRCGLCWQRGGSCGTGSKLATGVVEAAAVLTKGAMQDHRSYDYGYGGGSCSYCYRVGRTRTSRPRPLRRGCRGERREPEGGIGLERIGGSLCAVEGRRHGGGVERPGIVV